MEYTDRSVFITGRAGTGKSTLLRFFRTKSRKNVVVLAPTGVAALNVGGQTIHSFFGFRPDVTPETISPPPIENRELYRKLDTVVIDEVSMLRADLLDCVDTFLRKFGKNRHLPLGGVQMVFIGDLYQLPPVVKREEAELFKRHYSSPYFFSAFAFAGLRPAFIELEKVYRQKESEFLHLLNRIRNNTVTEEDLAKLNERVITDYEPKEGELSVYLTTTNDLARRVNEERLERLRGRMYLVYGSLQGNFAESDLPTDTVLRLKKGAQIMLLNNDSLGRWVNGTLGTIIAFPEIERREMLVEPHDGTMVEAGPYTWDIFTFVYDQSEKRVKAQKTGSFTQYPVRLAWAITIHKSQGLTFDRVIIDVGKGTFSHGQIYVVLSRCRSLEGVILKKPILKKHILMDWRIIRFLTDYQYALAEENLPGEEKVILLKRAIEERKMLRMVYLKANGEKRERVIVPLAVQNMSFQGREFLGLRALLCEQNEERVFRVDRILALHEEEDLPGHD